MVMAVIKHIISTHQGYKWLHDNKIRLNKDRTNFIYIKPNNKDQTVIKIANNDIECMHIKLSRMHLSTYSNLKKKKIRNIHK